MASLSDLESYATQEAEAAGIPTNLFLWQIGQESSWNPNAQNGNASGIAQFMPGTAAEYGVNTSDPYPPTPPMPLGPPGPPDRPVVVTRNPATRISLPLKRTHRPKYERNLPNSSKS